MSAIFPSTPSTTVSRKELIAYVKVNEVWVPVGYHCTDSSITVDIETETQKDILGNTFTNASTPALSQTFDPLDIPRESNNANTLQQMLHDQWMSQDFSKTYDTLIVYLYAGTGTPGEHECKYDAHHFPQSTITPGDFGGSADEPLNHPITIHYGGTMEVGTVTYNDKVPTFAKAEGTGNVTAAKKG